MKSACIVCGKEKMVMVSNKGKRYCLDCVTGPTRVVVEPAGVFPWAVRVKEAKPCES